MFIIETKCLSDYSHNNDEKLLSVEINHNPNWSYILDHPYRTLMFGGSRSGKANVLLNLIKNQWTKLIYISKILLNWRIICLSKEEKK